MSANLRSFFGWIVIACITPFWMIFIWIVWPFCKTGAEKIFFAWFKFWANIFGVNFEVQNESGQSHPAAGYVYVQLNQVSLADTLIVPLGIRNFGVYRQFANIEYLLIPFYGWTLWLLGAICVVRQNHALALKASERGIRCLMEGKSIGLSAEGMRSPDGKLLPYKKGAAVMAIKAQKPILPLIIFHSREVWEPGTWVVKPGKIVLRLLPPISTIGLTYEDRNQLTHRLHRLAEEQLEYR